LDGVTTSASKEKVYGYLDLLGITCVFSGLANSILLFYWLVRKNFFFPYEPLIFGIVLCIIFSALGQRLSRISRVGKWIFGISTYSSIVNYMLFVSNTTIDLSFILLVGFPLFLFALVVWIVLQPIGKSVSQMRFSMKAKAIVLGASSLLVFIIVFTSIFYQEIASFLDAHSWTMTLISVIASIIVAFLGGRSIGRKKNS
jgi:hypothetical protein